MSAPAVIVVGSCNLDLAVFTQRHPRAGETITGTHFSSGFGGKGANQAVCASKLGVSVAMVAKVGLDFYGDEQISNFTTYNINTSHVTRAEKGVPTGIAQICVETETGTNTIVIVPGANGQMSIEDVDNSIELFRHARVTICQLEIPQETSLRSLRLGKKEGQITILNPAPAGHLIDGILEATDILCPNEIELQFYSGDKEINVDCYDLQSVECAAQSLISKGASDVIVTLGGNGVFWVPGRFSGKSNPAIHFPAPMNCNVVDTTGAGDAFIGSLGAYLAAGYTLQRAIECAVQIASLSVEKRGAQLSYPASAELPIDLRITSEHNVH